MTEATHQIICDEFGSLAQQFKKQVSCYGLFSELYHIKSFMELMFRCEISGKLTHMKIL